MVERCQSAGCSTFTAIVTVGANTTSYSNTGLAASTSYSYRVAADQRRRHLRLLEHGVGDDAGDDPGGPSGLTASAASASQINLTWTDHASNESGFVVERCQGAGCSSFAAVGTVGANTTSYNNTGLTASTSYSYRVAATNGAGTSAYPNTTSATTPGPPPPPPFAIRINTGGPAFTDAAGQAWSADQDFSGGGAYTASVSIAGTVDDVLYQSERWCTSCSYSIPVPNGSYEVVLHFAEIFWSSANERVFDVSIEGTVVIDNLDIAATVGALTALVQTFPATVSDGTLTVSLLASTDNATIEALEVRPAGFGAPAAAVQPERGGGIGEPDQPDLERPRGERGRLRDRALSGRGVQHLCRDRDVGRQRDQLQQHGAGGVDELLISGHGDQRRRHLRVLEHGDGDDAGTAAAPSAVPDPYQYGRTRYTDAAGQAWSADQVLLRRRGVYGECVHCGHGR